MGSDTSRVRQQESANHQVTKYTKGHQVNFMYSLVKLCVLGVLVVKSLYLLLKLTDYQSDSLQRNLKRLTELYSEFDSSLR